MGDLTRNFDRVEFACPCCGKDDIDPDFVDRLQAARTIAGFPFIITSGVRCKKHQEGLEKQGLSVEKSAHALGLAADIKTTSSWDRYAVLDALKRAGFKRFGIGRNFIHVDMDKSKPQDVAWDYYE